MAFQDALISRPVSVVTPVVSSLAGAVRNYVLGVLPARYIQDYFIDTEIPLYRKMNRRRFRPMTQAQVEVRRLPLLSIKVETTADSSDFSTGTTYWTSTHYIQDPLRLTRLVVDDANQTFLGFETERVVVRFQLSFTVETDLKATELAMYLRRTLPTGQRFYLNDLDMATELPGDVVRNLWAGADMGDPVDPANVERFGKYLASVTAGNVEQVVNSANGRVAFAFSYRANPLMNITGAPTVSVNRDGNVVRSAQVDLPFEADVAVPVAYALRQELPLPAPAADSETVGFFMADGAPPYFSASVRMRPPHMLPNGLALLFFTSLVTGDPDPMDMNAPDVTDFSATVGPRSRALVEALLARGDTDRVDAKLWMDGNETPAGDWEFDPEAWALEIRKPTLQSRQKYHFAVYADTSELGKLAPESRPMQPPSPMIRRRT
jgi:hypothetical protein